MLSPEIVDSLRVHFQGQLIQPQDQEYNQARRVWNGMINKYPALIARCKNVDDAIACVQFARETGLPLAVRGGGHNVAGNAVCDGGIVVDFLHMKEINLDPEHQTVRAQPGVTWGEYDLATQVYGLGSTGGLISTTGIAGLTLGGGIGWLVRKYGLACDNLIGAEVITAEGHLIKANSNENPDLFWGLRGGGGNFGIVTQFEYRLHPVGQVLGGLVAYPLEEAREFLQFLRDFSVNAPDEISLMVSLLKAPPAPFVPQSMQGIPIIAIIGCFAGEINEGEKVLRPIREFDHPVIDLFNPIPYVTMQSMLDGIAPAGFQNYWKSDYLADLSDEAIDTMLNYGSDIPSPMTHIDIHPLGGAYARVGENETAFSHRDAPYALNIVSMWSNPKESPEQIRWTRDLASDMHRFSTGGVYVNFLGNEGEDRVRAAYGDAKYDQLTHLKAKYDPTNFFHLNQNIQPRKG
jgi:hypothetical protein